MAGHDHGSLAHGHGHSHGLVDRSIARSRAGLRTVAISLVVLLVTAAVQAAIFVSTGSVALLADLIHNFGDALTALPLAVAFALRSATAERRAGYVVVGTIFVSACVVAVQAVDRLLHPQTLDHLPRSPQQESSASSATRSLRRCASAPGDSCGARR